VYTVVFFTLFDCYCRSLLFCSYCEINALL